MNFTDRFRQLCDEAGVTQADIDGGMSVLEFARRLQAGGLRPYQREALQAVESNLATVVRMPVGSGKSRGRK